MKRRYLTKSKFASHCRAVNGGRASQRVQALKRMTAAPPDYRPIPDARGPRWSVGIRDNWSGESDWIVFRSFRDLIKRFRTVMDHLAVSRNKTL